jgi:hypothetical protein
MERLLHRYVYAVIVVSSPYILRWPRDSEPAKRIAKHLRKHVFAKRMHATKSAPVTTTASAATHRIVESFVPELVVHLAFPIITQGFVGSRNLLELYLVSALIRMMLDNKLLVRLPDIVFRCIRLKA